MKLLTFIFQNSHILTVTDILMYSVFRLSVARYRRLATVTAGSLGPARQIENNTPAAQRLKIE